MVTPSGLAGARDSDLEEFFRNCQAKLLCYLHNACWKILGTKKAPDLTLKYESRSHQRRRGSGRIFFSLADPIAISASIFFSCFLA
jgi:hypothetical protein